MYIQSGELVIILKLKVVKRFFRSLQFWLFIAFMLIGMLPMMIYRETLLKELERSQIQGRINEIQNQGRILSNQIASRGYLDNINNDVLNTSLSYLSGIYDSRIMIVGSNFRIVKDTYVLEEGRINLAEDVLTALQGDYSDRYQVQNGYIEFIFPIYDGIGETVTVKGVMVISASTERMGRFVDNAFERTHLLEMVAFVLLLLVSFVVSKGFVKPLKTLIAGINHVADDNFEHEISISTFSETKEISDAVSKTLSRLKILDDSRQEFVSNVSHELKTPITSIRVLADSLMAQEDVPIELYREFMQDISDEIDRESKIIDDLLSLVKMDKTHTELSVVPVDMNELLKLIFKRLRPLANRKNIEMVLESFRAVTAEIDEVKMTLAISNLIENAIKYNSTDGWVRVTLDADHKFCYIKVADSGIGIPEEFQNHIFERFYRVDKARSREKGGTGLGLSIAKNVVSLHHGAIRVSSKENEGTTFTVRIPLTYVA